MSLILNGTSQYAHTAMSISAYPFGIAGWVKNDDDSLSRWIAALQRSSSGNRWAAQLAATSLNARNQLHGGSEGQASQSGVAEGEWEPFAAWFDGVTSRWSYTNAGSTENTTNITTIPTPVDLFTIGARRESGGAADLFLDGKVAHIFTFTADPSGWFSTFMAGGYPLSLGADATHYWPLTEDYSDLVGGATLTAVGSPTFDSADNPPVILDAAFLAVRTAARPLVTNLVKGL